MSTDKTDLAAARRELEAERETHAALRGRIEGLAAELDGIEEGAKGDRVQHEWRRRPRSASQAQGVASASKHAANRLRALLTPDPEPLTDGGP